jgi:hypothetical protein
MVTIHWSHLSGPNTVPHTRGSLTLVYLELEKDNWWVGRLLTFLSPSQVGTVPFQIQKASALRRTFVFPTNIFFIWAWHPQTKTAYELGLMLIYLDGLYNLPAQEGQNRMLLTVIHSTNIYGVPDRRETVSTLWEKHCTLCCSFFHAVPELT